MRTRMVTLALLLALGPVSGIAQEVASTPPRSPAAALSEAIATEEYWTLERMALAQPMPIPGVVVDVDDASTEVLASEAEAIATAVPGFAPGWQPGPSPQPRADDIYEYQSLDELPGGLATAMPQHGSAPTNPLKGPYGPFQRWTVFDSIKKYPKLTIGKLFFSLGGGNYVCSASVIHRNTLVTAGHCVSDGSGNFGSNFFFCPGRRKGVSPRGCWAWTYVATSSRWHNQGDPDYDYACIVTPATGTTRSDRIGNVTGWLGRAWNWPHRQQEQTFGYPQGAPFDGERLITTASPDWYSFHFRSGRQISKIIGSDLTGGSSGGPWILGWHRPGHEFPDSDGRKETDPGANWVNGVNSHKRCRVSCQSPPTNTNGVFWQEMSSPPFRRTNDDGGESEDIFAACFDNGGKKK